MKTQSRVVNRLARVCVAAVLFLLLTTFFFLACTSGAACGVAEAEGVEEDFSDRVHEDLDSLDLDAFQGFWDGYSDEGILDSDLKNAITAVLNGEMTNFSDLYALLFRTVLKAIFGCLPAMISVVIICVMKSMLTNMGADFEKRKTAEIVHAVCYAAVLVIVLSEISLAVKTAYETVSALQKYSAVIFPVLTTLTSALGGVTTTAVYQPAVSLLSVGIIGLITSVTIPLFLASTVFAAVGNISGNVRLDKLTRLTRGVAEWILGIVFGLFVSVLGVQGAVGAAADKVTVSAARFALSSYVPILGGYISEGFDLVYASCILLKNAVGYVGLIVLFAVIIYPLAKLAALMLAMKLTAAIIEPLGEKRVSDFLSVTAKNLVVIISALIGVAFLFFVVIMLLILSLNII